MDGIVSAWAAPARPHGSWTDGLGGRAPASGPAFRLWGFVVACALHMAALAALCLTAVPRPPAPPDGAMAVVFTRPAPAAEPVPQTIAARTLATAAREVPVALAAIPALRSSGDGPRLPWHRAARPVMLPKTPAAVPPQTAALRVDAPPHPASDAGAVSPPALARWESLVRQAVQDAVVYPPVARLRRRQGRAQVRFDYDAGAVALAAIVRTSDFAPLDAAALAAVTRAALPAPPPGIGARRTMLVWVAFTLVADD